MQLEPSVVRYSGTYRFDRRIALERALARARSHIEDDSESALEGGWLRCFVMLDNTITVNLALPAVAEHRFIAAEVFAILAADAVDGSVTATIDDALVDEYVSGDGD